VPYNEFFDPTQLCGIEDDKEEESYKFEPLTYSTSTTSYTSSSTTSHTDSLNTSVSTAPPSSSKSTLTPPKGLPKLEDHSQNPSNDTTTKMITTTKTTTTTTTTTATTTTLSLHNDHESSIRKEERQPIKELDRQKKGRGGKDRAPDERTAPPPKMAMNMEMSKFKALHKLEIILEQLQSKRIRRFKSPKTLNTYYIPWIISNIQNSLDIKKDPELMEDLKRLMIQYQEWHPVPKSFKLLKLRLAPIRDMLRLAGITITPEDLLKMKQSKQNPSEHQESSPHPQEDISMNDQSMKEISSILYKDE